MPALVMTAAEIAAAEAAAIAAAEAAAIQAAQVAAAEAAAAAAAEAAAAQAATQAATQAGTQAAAQAGTQAATQASTSGIQALAQEVGANTATTAATTPPTGIQQIANAGNFPGSATNPLTTPPVASPIPPAPNIVPPGAEYIPPSNFGSAGQGFSQAEIEAIQRGEEMARVSSAAPPTEVTAYTGQGSMLNPSANSDFGASSGANLGEGSVSPSTGPSLGGEGTGYRGPAVQIGGESNVTPYTEAELKIMSDQSQGSGLQGLLDKGMAYAEKHPITTGLGAMSAYNILNQPKPYKREKYKSTFDSSTYKPYEPTPPDPYRPQYPQYAQGGLADLGRVFGLRSWWAHA
jgi:hypothetical protein